MEFLYVIKMKRTSQIKVSLQRHTLIQLKIENKTKVLLVIDDNLKISLQYGSVHHVKVTGVGAFESTIFSLQLEFIEIEILDPKIKAICHLNLALTLILHRLKVNDIFLLFVDYHGV